MNDDIISPLAKALAEDELGLFLFRLGIVELQDSTNTFKDKKKEKRYQKWKNKMGLHHETQPNHG
jgi:hypothetical protein